jgi:ferredoxin
MKKWSCVTVVVSLMMVLSLTGLAIAAEGSKKITLTKENPISINAEEKSVSILCAVNGKYFLQPTRHCTIFDGGKFADKAIFRSFVNQLDFYDTLMKVGLNAGNNMTLENTEATHVQGDLLDVAVTWDGANKDYTLDEVIIDSNGKPIVMRFGGNYETAKEKNTGCLLCLDSCPVGIISNETYTYGAVEKRNEVGFKGNKDVLPPDGTLVMLTIKRK